MAMLSKLLINDYIAHYGITNKTVAVDCKKVSRADFDLEDMPSPFDVLSFGAGEFSLKGNNGSLEVVHYEDFVNQCKNHWIFLAVANVATIFCVRLMTETKNCSM